MDAIPDCDDGSGCYDWDPDYLVWNEDELVFRASTFRWPDRGVVERWYDATDAQY